MADASEDLAAPSQAATKTKSPPRDNLPIPRELRDEIYSYLLDSRSVQDGAKYHFHTHVLGINKTIKHEAEEYLHKHHTFILVSHQWAGLSQALTDIIPTLSTKKECIQKFKHWSMHIHLKCGLSATDRQVLVAPAPDPKPQLQWFLMLGEDVDILAGAVQLRCQSVFGSVVLVDNVSGSLNVTPRHRMIQKGNPSVAFKLQHTAFRTIDSTLQTKLFDSLQGLLLGEKLKVTVQGAIADDAHVDMMKRAMSPELIWATSRKWGLCKSLHKLKYACDIELEDENYESALRKYNTLYQEAMFPMNPVLPGFPNAMTADEAQVAIDAELYDILVTIAWLSLRLGDMTGLYAAVQNYMDLFQKPHVDPALSYNTYFGGRHMAQMVRLHRPRALFPGYTNRQFLADLEAQHQPNADPRMAHDIAVFKKCANLDELASPASIPLDQCAARTMKVEPFRSHGTGDPYWDGFVPNMSRTDMGWQNSKALAALTDEEKAKINKVQKENGVQVTDFSQPSPWDTLRDKYATIGNIKWVVPPKLTGEGLV